MTHLKDTTKARGIRCNRWNQGFLYITEDTSKVTCSTCLGKRSANRSQSVDVSGMALVGKILHKSWGYNMTLNTYYLITKQSARSVIAHEIRSKMVDTTGYMSGNEMPDPDNAVTKVDYSVDVKDTEAHPRVVKDYRFIVKKYGQGDTLYFIGGELTHSNSYWLHDGKPNYFNHCD